MASSTIYAKLHASTLRGTASDSNIMDSNSAKTPAGSVELRASYSAAANWASIIASIAPVAGGSIAYDAVSVDSTTGTSLTFSHTCTGSDRILVVGIKEINAAAEVVTGVTYAGTAMTKINSARIGNSERWMSLWYLINPATGANNIVISASSSTFIRGHGVSYTGVRQSAQPDASATDYQNSVLIYNLSLSSVADNCWHTMVVGNSSGTHSAGSGASLVSGPESAYATAHDAASADSITAQAVGHKVGQAKEGDTGYYVYRVCLIFDCATLQGATASIGKITLYESSSSINDAQSMYIVTGADVADTGVVLADFGDLLNDTTSWGSITNTDWLGPGDKDITLNTAGLAALQTAINAGGLLKLALRSGHDINNTPDAGFIERNYFLFSGPADVSTNQRPRLIVTYKASLPADDLSRVTGIRHIYKPGFFRMILSLGDVSNTIEIAEAKVRKELEIPEQQTPKPEPYPFAEEPRTVPPTPYRTGIIPPGPEPIAPEPGRPRIFPTTPGIVMPEETFRKIFPEAKPPTEPPTFGKVLGAAVRAAIPSPIRKAWRAITPWEEEAGETFGGEIAERFKSIRRFFGGS